MKTSEASCLYMWDSAITLAADGMAPDGTLSAQTWLSIKPELFYQSRQGFCIFWIRFRRSDNYFQHGGREISQHLFSVRNCSPAQSYMILNTPRRITKFNILWHPVIHGTFYHNFGLFELFTCQCFELEYQSPRDQSHKFHHAPVLYSIIHHIATEMCTLLFHSGVLRDMGRVTLCRAEM